MKANVWKSEKGNIVVVSLDNNVIIELDGKCYMFTKPDDPGVFVSQVRRIDYKNGQTPEQIIAEARKAYETNSPLGTSENHG